jgi:hypothetical protein
MYQSMRLCDDAPISGYHPRQKDAIEAVHDVRTACKLRIAAQSCRSNLLSPFVPPVPHLVDVLVRRPASSQGGDGAEFLSWRLNL